MKSRNREVNIFNMSLLDILCGALGAFCFMMLALFPDHIKARQRGADNGDAQQRAEQAEQRAADAEQRASEAERRANEAAERAAKAEKEQEKTEHNLSSLHMRMAWSTVHDVDFWVRNRSGMYLGPKPGVVPQDKFDQSTNRDALKGPALEGAAFVDVAFQGSVFVLFARIHATNGATGGTNVDVDVAVRLPASADGSQSSFQMFELNGVPVTQVGQMVEIATLTYVDGAFDFTQSGRTPPAPQSRMLRPGDVLSPPTRFSRPPP